MAIAQTAARAREDARLEYSLKQLVLERVCARAWPQCVRAPSLGPQERPRETGRTAVALERDLAARVLAHAAARGFEPAAGHRQPLEHDHTARGEGEDVAAHARELFVRHVHER